MSAIVPPKVREGRHSSAGPTCRRLARQLDLDPIGIVNGAAVALFCAPVSYLPHYLDTLDHEPNHGPTPFERPVLPFLDRPIMAKGFSQGLSVPIHDAPSLKRLLLPFDLRP